MRRTMVHLLAGLSLLIICLALPGARAVAAERSAHHSRKTPVLLIHGLQMVAPYSPEDLWRGMAQELSGSRSCCNLRSAQYAANLWFFPARDADHRDVYVSDYCRYDDLPTLLPFSFYVHNLSDEITYVLAREQGGGIDLVGHSMGGLAARRFIEQAGTGNPVRTCVLIGSPSRILPMHVVLDLSALADLSLLQDINRGPAVWDPLSQRSGSLVQYYTIAGELKSSMKLPLRAASVRTVGTDGLVWSCSVGLADAHRNFLVRYVDHTDLIQNQAVATAVRRILDGRADSVQAVITTGEPLMQNNWFYELRSGIISLLCCMSLPAGQG